MKLLQSISIFVFLLNILPLTGQKDSIKTSSRYVPNNKLMVLPAVGLKPYPMPDLTISNLIQWNIKSHLTLVSHTSLTFNHAFLPNFNHIQTDYNITLSQKFGLGTLFYTKHSSHTFAFMAGIKYDAYKETLNNPEFENVTASVNSISPDFGLMYNLMIGRKKYFFNYRMYVPLYPYPFKTTDITGIEGNLTNISFEVGFGIRLK